MTIAPSTPDRPSRLALRPIAAGFGMGLLLALATSAAIAGERIARGAFEVALFANAVTTAAALALFFSMARGAPLLPATPPAARPLPAAPTRPLIALAPQVTGAIVGVLLVHLVLRREALAVAPWLSERPAQFVNDAAAVAGFLALIWAAAADLDARMLALAFLGMTLYRVTSPMWHLDRAPGGFSTSVQDLVVAQFVAAALAIGLFRTALLRPGR